MKRQVLRASLDDFKRPWSEAHRYDRLSGAGYFRNAFDYERIEQLLLAPAAAGGTGNVALCSIDPLTQVDHSESTVDIESNGVLIVDGVFAFRSEINDFWDLKIWIDVDPELSIERGVRRDTAMEGSNEAAEELHRGRYQGSERIYLVECDPIDRADIVIDNRNFEAPRPIKSPQ